MSVRIQVCLNGSHQHHQIPIGRAALAAEAAALRHADSIHFHPKTPAGNDSLDDVHLTPALHGLREVTVVPLGVTTGACIDPDPAIRAAAIHSCTSLPVRPR